jgi:hypothetical protein
MMNVSLDDRSVDPQLRTILQSKIDRRLNNQVIDGLERLRGQSDEAALNASCLGTRAQ